MSVVKLKSTQRIRAVRDSLQGVSLESLEREVLLDISAAVGEARREEVERVRSFCASIVFAESEVYFKKTWPKEADSSRPAAQAFKALVSRISSRIHQLK